MLTDNRNLRWSAVFAVPVVALFVTGCAGGGRTADFGGPPDQPLANDYIIGPGDTLQVFVWRNDDVSTTIQVRPDGKISTPLVEDMQAVGKTPTQLGRDIEQALSEYIRSPIVTVIVTEFVGTFNKQIRVVGQAAEPRALSYRDKMTLLDVMIEVGGLAEAAAGNRAKVVRWVGDEQVEIKVRLDDLLNGGDISANLVMWPGDVLIIPESIL